MKKLLSLFALLLITVAVMTPTDLKAQAVAAKAVPTLTYNTTATGTLITAGLLKSAAAHVATDTASNSTMKHQYATIEGWQDKVNIQVTATKISGTPTGYVKLYGSGDGVTWEQIGTDSLAITNVSAAIGHIFKITSSDHIYFDLRTQMSGTAAVKLNSMWWTRRKPVMPAP